MTNILRYSDDYRKQWDDFIKSSKQPLFMFERDYMEYHSDRFVDHSLLFFNEDELIALLPISQHGNELRSHGGLTYGGFITNTKMKQYIMQECLSALLQYMNENDFLNLLYKPVPHIYHLQPAEEDLYSISLYKPKIEGIEASTVISLNNPIKMPKGRKAQISRAKRERVQIEKASDIKDFKAFIELENKILRDRHNTNAVHTAEELYYLFSKFPNNIALLKAVYNENLIAGIVIYIYEKVIHTQYMAADETARRIGALDLVISYLIDKYKEEKEWLDFGISTENNGLYLNEGLISQKEGFGGRTNIYTKLRLSL